MLPMELLQFYSYDAIIVNLLFIYMNNEVNIYIIIMIVYKKLKNLNTNKDYFVTISN